jgi:glycosyltransferase involved in cell wall biosynthesis
MDMPTPPPDRRSLPVVACVTAYNEEGTIGDVLAALKACEAIDRIQVVDDGSTDRTREIAENAGVTVISLPERVPVGQAIMHHLTSLDDETILLWCDADLLGLRADHAADLIGTFRSTDFMQVMSSRGVPPNWPGWLRNGAVKAFWAWLFGPISGERAILKSDFEAAIGLARRLDWAEMMRGYGIVLFLNWYAGVYGRGSRVRYFDTLRQRQKYQKWDGDPVRQMLRQWGQFIIVWVRIRLNAPRIRAMARPSGSVQTAP